MSRRPASEHGGLYGEDGGRGRHLVQRTGPDLTVPVMAAPSWRVRLGGHLNTTPGRMRLASAGIVAGLILLGAVGIGSLRARQHATHDVGAQAEPLLVGSEVIYSQLADADATSAGTFLSPGLEPPDRRARYLDDMKMAADQLAAAARQVGTSPDASRSVATITRDLPIYAGLIEAARADNRQGLPVGAAYLREGSAMMRDEILPATGSLYQVEANRLSAAYRAGGSAVDTGGVALAGVLALALLIATHLFLVGRTNRLLNLPLLAATVLTVLAAAGLLLAFTSQSSHLHRAQSQGSDPVQLLSSARILTFRAQADEGLALVARGGGDVYTADFKAIVARLGPPDGSSGLVHQADQASGSVATPAIGGSTGLYASYLGFHGQVGQAEQAGNSSRAVALATGPELAAEDSLALALEGAISRTQASFGAQATQASNALGALGLVVPILVVAAAGLAVAGLQQRISEYR